MVKFARRKYDKKNFNNFQDNVKKLEHMSTERLEHTENTWFFSFMNYTYMNTMN